MGGIGSKTHIKLKPEKSQQSLGDVTTKMKIMVTLVGGMKLRPHLQNIELNYAIYNYF